MSSPSDYERRTWEGRKICDKNEMREGYCGSVSLELHVQQMRDPDSWIHSHKKRWLAAAIRHGSGRKAVIEDLMAGEG